MARMPSHLNSNAWRSWSGGRPAASTASIGSIRAGIGWSVTAHPSSQHLRDRWGPLARPPPWDDEADVMRVRRLDRQEAGGVLTEGGERAAPFLSQWTPPRYAEVWEPAGYRPIQRFHNYVVDLTAPDVPDRIADHLRRAEANGVRIRHPDRRRFDRELRTLAELHNSTFDRHWGHDPVDVDAFVE